MAGLNVRELRDNDSHVRPTDVSYLPTSRLVLHVLRGADLGPDALQVRHGRGGGQRGRRAGLQGAGGLGRGAHHRDLLHLVGLGSGLCRKRLAGGRLGGAGAAVSTLIWSSQRGDRSEVRGHEHADMDVMEIIKTADRTRSRLDPGSEGLTIS